MVDNFCAKSGIGRQLCAHGTNGVSTIKAFNYYHVK